MTNITITKTSLTVSGELTLDNRKEIIKFINNINDNELNSNSKSKAKTIVLNKKPSDTYVIIM